MTNMSRRFRAIALRASCAALFCVLAASGASAQFLGYTSPQTVTQVLATAVACTGTAQTYNIQNLGQTQHYAYLAATSTPITAIYMYFQGVDAAGNVYQISDTAVGLQAIANQTNPSLSATGYYPKMQIVVICEPASTGAYTLNYTGTSSTSNQNAGGYQLSQVDKNVETSAPANAAHSVTFQAPFSSSAGTIFVEYDTASLANQFVGVQCSGTSINGTYVSMSWTLANVLTLQSFVVPPVPCSTMSVSYTPGAASAGHVSIDYLFQPPGVPGPVASSSHVTGTTATVVKSGTGVLTGLVIGTPAAGTVSLFNLQASSCTATPSTNTVAVLTINATDPANTIPFDAYFSLGICLKASVAMDLTAVYR